MKDLRESEKILLKIAHLSIGENITTVLHNKLWDAFQLGRDYETAVKNEQKKE